MGGDVWVSEDVGGSVNDKEMMLHVVEESAVEMGVSVCKSGEICVGSRSGPGSGPCTSLESSF